MARRGKSKSKGSAILALVAIALIGILAISIGPRVKGLLFSPPDFAGPGQGQIEIEIKSGDSIAKIGNTLKAAGVVQSVDAFTLAAGANPDSKKIAAGFYQMLLQMSAKDAVSRLLDPNSKIVTRVVIPEGKRAAEIFARISAQTGIPVSEFEAIANDPSSLPLPDYAQGRIEGFLFPATYEFPPGTTALSALTEMVEKFNSIANQINLEQRSVSLGFNAYEILTSASIVEVEGQPVDFAKVARVIYNRLALPMRLEFDSTVNYGLGRTDAVLTTELLKKDTPYNSYLNPGLPPTPITNPGVAALEAALNPASGDWIYFITSNLDTRETKFTSDYSQFLVWKDEFLAYCKLNPDTCYQ